jgi:predicted Zn-dependent protease
MMTERILRMPHARAFVVASLALAIGGCSTNPVTGKRELSLVSESQEISMGQEAATQAKASIGVTQNPALQSYVTSLGMTLARGSERPELPWSFTVVEDAAVNAFALPGGPVFVTRGILAHMNSEAELVSVLGHEIGHITARHSASQISKSQLAQIGVVAAVVVKPELAQFGDIANAGLGLLFMKFGRDDETQADDLGFRYMTKAGYDPHEMAAMFQTLERMSAASGGGRVPEWQSTHPDPGNRVAKTRERIAATPALPANLKVERDAFLQRLDGLMYGEDPRQGFFRGTSFLHPDMKFQFDFPAGWKTQNQASQVVGMSAQDDAVVVMTLAGQASPSQALQEFISAQGMQGRGSSNAAINGLPAASASFTATTESGTLGGWVAFINLDGTTLRLIGYTPADRLGTYDTTLRNAITSFRRLTEQTALNVQAPRIRLVRINRAMTIEEFNRTNPSTIPLAQVALINGVEPTSSIPPGTLVKRVTN